MQQTGKVYCRPKPQLVVDIIGSDTVKTGAVGSPIRFSADDIDLDRRRTPVAGRRNITQDDINSPRNVGRSQKWDSPNSPGNVFAASINLDDANTLDLRRQVVQKRNSQHRAYNVETEIDGEVIGSLRTMSIDDFEYGSMIAAMEEVMNLPQQTCMLITKEDMSFDGIDDLRFNDDDEFDESEQDRVLVDCVINDEDRPEEVQDEVGFEGLAASSDSDDDGSKALENYDESSVEVLSDTESELQSGEVGVEEKDPFVRAEKIRVYIQKIIGPINFEKAYSLMKVVETSEDDDAILEEMESIVGVEGLHLIDTFINLISLEDELCAK